MSEEDAEKSIQEQKEVINAMKFKVRSRIVKTKSGKKPIALVVKRVLLVCKKNKIFTPTSKYDNENERNLENGKRTN